MCTRYHLCRINVHLWVIIGKNSQTIGQFPEMSFLVISRCLSRITLPFIFFFILLLFSELFAMSKNAFDLPNTGQGSYFHWEKQNAVP